MKRNRKLSRRSFLATVAGSAVAGGGLLASQAGALQTTDRDPSDLVGRGRGGGSGVTDRDPSDPVGRGRGGNRGGSTQRSGVTDSDPGDPIGGGRGTGTRSGLTDSDPSDPVGNGTGNRAVERSRRCSDSDPGDPVGGGRNCRSPQDGGTTGSGTTQSAHQTGRRERRYEVCWVDHPSRSNDDCNIQTYSEWQITWSDGRVEHDTAESARRRAEMEARGYTARWHRFIVNEW